MKHTAEHATFEHELGRRIRQLRMQQGISQVALAQELGISFQQVQKYETGLNRVSVSRLCDIARFLEVPLNEFFSAGQYGLEENALSLEQQQWLALYDKCPRELREKACKIMHVLTAP